MATHGVKLRKVVLWMGMALGAAALMSAQVYRQNLYIRLAREHVQLEKEAALVQNDLAGLELEVKSLSKRQRLEQLAQTRFGLVYAGSPEPIYLEGNPRTGEVSEMAMAAEGGSFSKKSENDSTALLKGAVQWLTSAL